MDCVNKIMWLNSKITYNPNCNKFIIFTSTKVFSPMISYISGWHTRPPNLISQDVLFRIAVSMMFKYVQNKNEALSIHQDMITVYKTLRKKVQEKELSELPFQGVGDQIRPYPHRADVSYVSDTLITILKCFDMDNDIRITQEEIDLIKRAKSGDKIAFSTLFYKYKTFVEKLLLSYIKDEDEAKDIANVVFVKMHNKLSKFVNYESFGGWLRILTKNTAIDYLRSIKNKQVYVDPVDFNFKDSDNYKNVENNLINKLTFDKVLSLIPKLNDNKRKICTMYYVEGYTIVDISKRLGKPLGTIKSVLHRFRKQVYKLNLIN